MRAWLLKHISDLSIEKQPLHLEEIPVPVPKDREILIRVSCCGVCHTELDEIEGRTAPDVFPVVPGHQVIGIVEQWGMLAERFHSGDRVGVAWIYSACGVCEYCIGGLENLCANFKATGRDEHGGYAEYMVVDEQFAYAIPGEFKDIQAAPLLCAGAIGYRALRLTGLSNGKILGLSGFGASGHLTLQMARYLYPGSKVIVYTRSPEEQSFAMKLGASWAGTISDRPPYQVNAIIDTTPVWKTLTGALLHLKPGGRLVINAIRKEDFDKNEILKMTYQDHLWMEKEIKTVANITRTDVEDFLRIAAKIPLIPAVETYPFERANDAILDLKHKQIHGAKVLVV